MPLLTYVICTAPRTGSTLLTEGLAATGQAGRPAEYFAILPKNARHWVSRLGIRNDVEYVDKVIDAATGPNGVCGLKLHWHQTSVFQAKLASALNAGNRDGSGAALVDLVQARFGEVLHLWLRRHNKVAQGISYYRASRTGQWFSFEERRERKKKPPDFDFCAIDRMVGLCVDFDRQWESYFRRHRIGPLVLVYEEFVNAYAATIRAVLQFLGLPEIDAVPAPRLEQQADETSREWERRYRAISAARRADDAVVKNHQARHSR